MSSPATERSSGVPNEPPGARVATLPTSSGPSTRSHATAAVPSEPIATFGFTASSAGPERSNGVPNAPPGGLVAEVEGDKVRLSANADVAVLFEEEKDGS